MATPPLDLSVQGTARQGGVLFVTVHGADPLHHPRVSWLGQTLPLAADGAVLRAVLAVPVDTPPGGHALKVESDEGEALSHTVEIAHVYFPHQSLSLPVGMLATYDSPRAKRDDELLLSAARKFIAERYWHGSFSLPAAGPFSTGFGEKRTYNGWRKGWHKGLDIAAGPGASIHAPNDGVVTVVGAGMLVNGNCTLINHGFGVCSLYMHQSRIHVRDGERVRRGQLIGNVGSTGAGTGPHLHWGCYVHGIPVDPKALLHVPPGW